MEEEDWILERMWWKRFVYLWIVLVFDSGVKKLLIGGFLRVYLIDEELVEGLIMFCRIFMLRNFLFFESLCFFFLMIVVLDVVLYGFFEVCFILIFFLCSIGF